MTCPSTSRTYAAGETRSCGSQPSTARNVRIFGSVARGEEDTGSDVDILVEMEPGRSLLDRAALLVHLRELLRCDVDVATEKSLRPRVREEVLREAVPL